MGFDRGMKKGGYVREQVWRRVYFETKGIHTIAHIPRIPLSRWYLFSIDFSDIKCFTKSQFQIPVFSDSMEGPLL
jgi:hypothetical protein